MTLYSRRLLPLLAAALAAPALASAQAPAVDLEFPIERFELDNGLQVIVSEDHSSPTVAIAVYYDVGSRNEVQGRSGFAHLFEHMMFQGSQNIPKGGHFQYVSINGGSMNGTTSEDRTNYYEILPSDRLALGLWLEADRMRSLDISAENFENQRQVVKEERRLRIDNVPYMNGFLEFFDHAYDSFEYGHSVIGSMDDLDAAELSDVQAFFDLYYVPNNAVLTVVGDTTVEEVRQLANLYFGPIPAGEEPPAVNIVEPERTAMSVHSMEDPLATQPMVMVGWQVPPGPSEINDTLQVLDSILVAGQSSRLHTRLVRQEQAALEVASFLEGRRGPDIEVVYAICAGDNHEEVRDLIFDEIATLREEGVTQEELDTARTQILRATVSGVEEFLGRSLVLGSDALYYDDPGRINSQVERLMAVTVEDVNEALQTYFLPERATLMTITPAAAESADATDGEETAAGE
jgi:predicted Zn-dependent peptidase